MFRFASKIPARLWSIMHMDKHSPIQAYLNQSILNLSSLLKQPSIASSVEKAISLVAGALAENKPVLTCGNGGSASDALHISGELVGRFHLDRRALKVICLNSNVTVMTAWANDVGFDSVFARQVEAYGEPGGVMWGLSTSGNSRNVISATAEARKMRMSTIAMTGDSGGELAGLADCLISVPGDDAPSAQNMHVVLYHFICAEVERIIAA